MMIETRNGYARNDEKLYVQGRCFLTNGPLPVDIPTFIVPSSATLLETRGCESHPRSNNEKYFTIVVVMTQQ